MPLSAAPFPLRATSLALLLLAAAVLVTNGDAGSTMIARGNSTSVARPAGDHTEMYICYLCTGRNPLLIRYCPIYWDYCHLVCYDADADAAGASTGAVAPAPAPASRDPAAVPREDYGEECYVMKLYENGTYVIVTRRDCSQIARCLLSCGGGDVVLNRTALGAAAAQPVTATTPQGMLPPSRGVADFQRCGTQVMPPRPSAVPGGVY